MRRSGAPESATIVSLAHDGRGVARIDGKAVFVPFALPGETVTLRRRTRRSSYDEAELISVDVASPSRVTPRCSAFATCGGCALQHADPALQLKAKQTALLEELSRLGRVSPQTILEPLTGPVFGYRRRARLGVKYVAKKGRVLVGFRERAQPYIADLARCEVLSPPLDALIGPLASLIGALSIRERVPQVEVAIGEATVVLVLRNPRHLRLTTRRGWPSLRCPTRSSFGCSPGPTQAPRRLVPSGA